MKKLFLLITFVLGIQAAQAEETDSILKMKYVNVYSINNDDTVALRLYIKTLNDNQYDEATIMWYLRDVNGNAITSGTLDVDADIYRGWSKAKYDIQFLFDFYIEAAKMKLNLNLVEY